MRVWTKAALGGLAVAALAAGAGAAHATPSPTAVVTVTSEAGDGVAPEDGPSTLTLDGSGFQAVDGGFGGVYVMFGVVQDGWQPSQGGVFGSSYVYQMDSQEAENAGYNVFVSFPGSTTEAEANGGVLDPDGTWSAALNVPGPVLTVSDADGNESQVDCRVETCGVITMGAHGVVNANNETFTPVSFEPAAAEEPSETMTDEPSAVSETSEAGESAPSVTALSSESQDVGAADVEDGSDDSGVSGGVVAGLVAAVVVLGAVVTGFVLRRRRTDAGTGAGEPDSSAR